MQTPTSDDNSPTTHQPVDVFLSYASADGGVARLLAEELTNLGYEVWWDRLIPSGARWDDEIERMLEAARFVLVLWSPASADSDYVRAEARAASRRGTLISAVIEPCELPMPFGEFQAIDLVPWRTSGETAAVDDLRRALAGPPDAGANGGASDVAGQVEDSPVAGRVGAGVRSRVGPAAYVSDLVRMISGPKTFLRLRSADTGFVAAAAWFCGISIALQTLIGLPTAMKLGGSVWWEVIGAALYQPIKVLLIGVAVHMSWRLVGGRAAALTTVSMFAYVYGLLVMMYSATQNLAAGLLRALRPEVAERTCASIAAGRPEVMQQVVSEEGLLPATLLFLLAIWPLIVVPSVCWGAFRYEHRSSRGRSSVAAAIALVLGSLAYSIGVALSYVGGGPG